MRLIKPSFEIFEQGPGLEGIYEAIERAGRTCYKSKRPEGQTAKDFVDRMIASQHCYTGNSMVLTENGWMHWSSYNGEKVAVIDYNGSFARFETPERVVKHSYTGNFYYYPLLGLEVTEGHRMYGLFRESKNDFYNSTLYDVFICGQPYKDNNGRQKTLGERMFKVPKHCNAPIYTNPFYELVGFWLGDGCYQPQTVNKLVFHLKKERKVRYLQGLCEDLGYTFEAGKGNYYRVCSPQIGAKFNQLFYQNGKKYIPNMYMAEDAIAVKSIILGLINSDGSKGVNTKTVTFTSTSWYIIQWLDNVASIGGFTTSFKGICHETSVHNPVYKIFLLDTDYTINNDSRNPDSKVRITNKTEDVYCVTVSTGLILVRGDNGVTSICGNCAMLEHGTVYLTIRGVIKPFAGPSNFGKYLDNPYSKVVFGEGTTFYITTNYRVLVENGWLNDLQYLCEPTEFHEKRVTVKFTTSNGIMREFTRHRSHSFAVESTRYCNYSKEKFDHQVTFVIPSWANLKEGTVDYLMNGKPMWDTLRYTDGTVIKDNYSEIEMELLYSLKISENMYFNMIAHQAKPQEAREVLPLATKCDMVMTGFTSDWNHFFDLRARGTTGAPHPDAKALAEPLMGEFYKRGYIK